jgi:hypothetical protein
MFAYLRTKEAIRMQEHQSHEKGSVAELMARGRLYEVQEILAYMVHDYPCDPEKSELSTGGKE